MEEFQSKIIELTIESLKKINESRFYSTERGYQGRFQCALYQELDRNNILPNDAIIEEEYQKTIPNHGINQRPDIIIHIPVEHSGLENRKLNNFIVYALKKDVNKDKATADFKKLNEMLKKLDYDLGIFININGYPDTYLKYCEEEFKDRIHEFSVNFQNGKVFLAHYYFFENHIERKDYSN